MNPDVTKNLKVHSFMSLLSSHTEVLKRVDTLARHLQYTDSYTRTFLVPLSFGSKYGGTISLLVQFISYFLNLCVCVRFVWKNKTHQKHPPPKKNKNINQTNPQDQEWNSLKIKSQC